MRLAPLVFSAVLAMALVACGGGADSAFDDVASTETPAPRVTTALPDAVLGTFDANPARCAERVTMARVTTTPDSVRFYYGYASVDSVAAEGDGYRVDATMYHQEGVPEVVPEPVTYRIESTADGIRLDLGSPSMEPLDLILCAP